MKNRVLGALVSAALLGVTGCAKQAPSYGTGSGSLGISRDDAFLYAADTDSNQLLVIDSTTDALVAKVAVGESPEKVLVGTDDTVFVTNARSRSVSVVRRGDWKEAARIPVGVEPKGLGLSVDGKTLLVVSATALDRPDVGTLTAVDTQTLSPQWEVAVGNEPRAVGVIGDRAYVSLGKQGELVQVDLRSHQVISASSGLRAQLNRPSKVQNDCPNCGQPPTPEPGPGFNGIADLEPRGMEAIAVSPDGTQVLATGVLASDAVLNSGTTVAVEQCVGPDCPIDQPVPPDTGKGGDGYGGGSCGSNSVASPALLTFSAEGAPLVDDHFSCGFDGEGKDHPSTVIASGRPDMPVQGPVAAVIDPSGRFAFIANRETDNVSVLSMTRGGVQATKDNFGNAAGGPVKLEVLVGSGPTGIALSHDGTRAWTYNLFDHSVTRLESKDGQVRPVATTRMVDDVLPADVAAGRKLFFSAVDARMNNPGVGISCNSCHPDAREDGHVWNFTAGPRQTPSLAGRHLLDTAPFHWGGEFATLTDFMSHTVQRRMGGSGVSSAMEGQLKAFLSQVKLPDNPMKTDTLTPAQARGALVFTRAQCHTCHAGENLTDNRNADVGTLVKGDALPKGLNTPSLLGLSRTGPYLHDGSAASLKARILQGQDGNRHGLTADLSGQDVDDLVAYLQTK
ncbi:MAG: c-type cytochrome [Myxococcaceae bacterium]|nr:c-type cytochrome [Myxococcaceae bacterium]